MSASTAAARSADRTTRGPAPRRRPAAPRRVSGPARRPRTVAPAPSTRARLLRGLLALPDHHLLDRLIRGRYWIAVLGVGLLGIVAMQVAMLSMDARIGQSLERTAALERQNGVLSAEVSRLSSGERIQARAARMGMVSAPSTELRFLTAGRDGDASRAVATLRSPAPPVAPEPDPVVAETTAPAPTATTTTPTTGQPGTTQAPATGDPAAGAPASGQTATTPPTQQR